MDYIDAILPDFFGNLRLHRITLGAVLIDQTDLVLVLDTELLGGITVQPDLVLRFQFPQPLVVCSPGKGMNRAAAIQQPELTGLGLFNRLIGWNRSEAFIFETDAVELNFTRFSFEGGLIICSNICLLYTLTLPTNREV